MTFFCRNTDFDITYTRIFQNLLNFRFVFVGYLNDNTRIFRKQNLHDVVTLNLIEVDFHTTFSIGKAHFQKGSDHTSGRNIMSGKNQFLVYQFLNSEEGVTEVFRILYSRNIITYFVQGLSKC